MAHTLTYRVSTVALLPLALTNWACNGASTSDPPYKSSANDNPPAYSGTMITTSDGTKFVGDSVAIDVRNGPEPQVDLHVLAFSQDEVWTALIRLPANHVPTGSGEADIRQIPLQQGIAFVERQKKGQKIKGEDGTISYELDGKRTRMSIASPTQSIAGTLQATYTFRCWVKPEELGAKPNGTSPEGAVQVMLDETFKSDFCARFRP